MICPKCHGKEFILTSTGTEQVFSPCDCKRKKDEDSIIKSRLIMSGIPKDCWNFTPETYKKLLHPPIIKEQNSKNIEILENYINNIKTYTKDAKKVLWLYGTGMLGGRTVWASILGRSLISNTQYKVKFIVMHHLIENFTNFEDKKSFFEDLNKNHIFIIDNMFSSNRFYAKSSYIKIHLYNWLNDMINADKYLICTSNIPIISIESEYSECRNVLLRSHQQLELKGVEPSLK